MPIPVSPLTTRVLDDLAGHSGATAVQIAERTRTYWFVVFDLLTEAARQGRCRRFRDDGPWQWEMLPAVRGEE